MNRQTQKVLDVKRALQVKLAKIPSVSALRSDEEVQQWFAVVGGELDVLIHAAFEAGVAAEQGAAATEQQAAQNGQPKKEVFNPMDSAMRVIDQAYAGAEPQDEDDDGPGGVDLGLPPESKGKGGVVINRIRNQNERRVKKTVESGGDPTPRPAPPHDMASSRSKAYRSMWSRFLEQNGVGDGPAPVIPAAPNVQAN